MVLVHKISKAETITVIHMVNENMSFLNNDLNSATKRQLSISEYQRVKIKEFCESTSLHGFSFLYNAKSIGVRLVWIFAIVAMMGVGTYFLVDNTNAYLKSKLMTSTESSSSYLDVSISL